jgi:hypothetical protein
MNISRMVLEIRTSSYISQKLQYKRVVWLEQGTGRAGHWLVNNAIKQGE